jgi:hypothetical protein
VRVLDPWLACSLANKNTNLDSLRISQGRVMTKLCVTTNNGLYPLGHAQALATVSKSLADRWIQGVGGASVGPSQPPSQGGTPPAGVNAAVYAKSDLRFLSLSLSLSHTHTLSLSLSLSTSAAVYAPSDLRFSLSLSMKTHKLV